MFLLLLHIAAAYDKHNYNTVAEEFLRLNSTCPFLTLSTAQEKFQLPALSQCNNCKTLLADISNGPATSPHVYLSGCLHGNERLGPAITTELAKLLCSEYSVNPWIKRLVDTRKILITPMTNAQGYYRNTREERIGHKMYDPNRDFGYMPQESCMKTVTARTVARVFEEYLVQVSLTFHGGSHVAGYPWGSPNHIDKHRKSTEAPDERAFDAVANAINEYSRSDLIVGPMTDTVYYVYGGMEDWAYAGGWENNVNRKHPITNCSATTYGGFEYSQRNNEGIRQLIYLIELNDAKDPSAEKYGESSEVFRDVTGGLISQFIRMTLGVIDLARPYVLVEVYPYGKGLLVEWEVWGCVTVDKTFVKYRGIGSEGDFSASRQQKGSCRWGGHTAFYEYIETEGDLEVLVCAEVDGQWMNQDSPDPAVPPQTHIVKARNSEYTVNHNGYSIQGNTAFYSNLLQFRKKYSIAGVIRDDLYQTVARILFSYENHSLSVILETEIDSELTFKVSDHGDVRNDSLIVNIFDSLCGRTVEGLRNTTFTLENCTNPEILIGKAVSVYAKEKKVGSGVMASASLGSLEEVNGTCVVSEHSTVRINLQFSVFQNQTVVQGVVSSPPQGFSDITVSTYEGSSSLSFNRDVAFITIPLQTLELSVRLIGAPLVVSFSNRNYTCIVGKMGVGIPIDFKLLTLAPPVTGFWLYTISGLLFLGIFLFARRRKTPVSYSLQLEEYDLES